MKINIIGRGNVGIHLAKAFADKAEVRIASGREIANGETVKEILDPEAELTIIAVPDRAIGEVASKLGEYSGVVAHTSGATPLSVLDGKVRNPGVFYALQTFSKDRELDYSALPFFLEAGCRENMEILRQAAGLISSSVTKLSSEKRLKLHLAAVFANNFSNHMIALGQELLEHEGVDPRLLTPLVKETFGKLTEGKAKTMQTGPARRHDYGTIDSHLELLSSAPELQEVYRTVSRSIERLYP